MLPTSLKVARQIYSSQLIRPCKIWMMFIYDFQANLIYWWLRFHSITPKWMSLDFTGDKQTLVQVMADAVRALIQYKDDILPV